MEKGIPMVITLKSMRGARTYDIKKARMIIEDSLQKFLECKGSRTRLMYEVAVPGKELEKGAVKQRRPGCDKIVWMIVVDIPILKWDPKKEGALKKFFQERTQCSVEFFVQG